MTRNSYRPRPENFTMSSVDGADPEYGERPRYESRPAWVLGPRRITRRELEEMGFSSLSEYDAYRDMQRLAGKKD